MDWKETCFSYCALLGYSDCEDVTTSQIHSLSYTASIQEANQSIIELADDTTDEMVPLVFSV